MRRLIALILIPGFVLFLSACAHPGGKENEPLRILTDTVNPVTGQPPDTAKELESIVDNSKGMAFPGVLEVFFEDDGYTYSFGAPISEYVIVKYTDGSTEGVKAALENGHIQITDLDQYGICYFADPKRIENIVDLTEGGEIPTDTALEAFYRDDTYCYLFSTIKSHYVIVYYKDGTEEPVKDALAAGRIKITDLDRFGIHYSTTRLHNE